ncbi:peptidylprolyl isomerase [Micromonospora inositola]|uniref:Peptidyl-prolyl cis-trans isomerase B (Cyclophilin B) n=1 Tax=Micromonospora inositola TaxID=47865 RepID=A0A1C5JZR4_9ACTN|nr:peptidylprolyl isomerase [Micromonospora inositola]SCG75749.1 peptidyl-prolyl cis-trans isomerase B (cyclophilin B) [Micromonospora inositola]
MASSRDRQRKLARAKLDRQLARRAAAVKRRRQIQAGVGAAVVLALIVVASAWALGAFDSKPEQKAAEDVCVWTPQDASANTSLKDVGTPDTTGLPTSGTRAMTITTNQGAPITAQLDLAAAPCAGASIAHLAGKSFYDNTKCHEITTEGALRCGDPSGTGIGGPAYSFYDENIPTPAPSASGKPAAGQPPAYPKGTVAMIANPPGSNGSQFLVFFKDFNPAKPAYPVIGKVTGGLDVVEKIGALPTVDNGSGAKVKPKTDVVIQSLTVGEATTAPAATSAPTASPSAG